MPLENLAGKKIVVTAGWPREDIDGVRHYANHRRLESHGYTVASELAAEGADVTIIAPRSALVPPSGCRVIQKLDDGSDIMSGKDLTEAVKSFLAKNACSAVLCLASFSSICPAKRAENKLKIKSAETNVVSLPVVGNINIEARAQAWDVPVLGYNEWQEKFSVSDIPEWLSARVKAVLDPQDADYPTTPLQADNEDFDADARQNLRGKKVILTSGPTVETITTTGDVITNFSSGRQGYELALAFAQAGARIVYVVGPTNFPSPAHDNIQVVRTTSAKSMLAKCKDNLPADIFVGVAAVADFGCEQPFFLHLHENQASELVLDQNPDILSTMGHHPEQRPDVVVGFAAETDSRRITGYAKEKLVVKNADLICANLVGNARVHGGSENQIIFVVRGGGPRPLAVMSKRKAALTIVREVAAHFPDVDKTEATSSRDPSGPTRS